jgi:hypothetical protein
MSGKYLPRVPGARLARFVLGRYRATHAFALSFPRIHPTVPANQSA